MGSGSASKVHLKQSKKSACKEQNALASSLVLSAARHDRMCVYGYVLLVTSCMLILIFALRGIAPFGDRVLRYSGDGAQYYGILGYLQNTFYTNNDLLYSWSTVLGGNMIGTLAFYFASPFNLLTVFFPGHLMAAYHVIFVLKFAAAALCFAIMLENLFPKAEARAVILFASSYPFIGYMTYYGWNQSWMDGVILLPLVLLGIWQIVRYIRPWLYISALAVALLSNFYIGYMVCIASVLLFVCLLVIQFENAKRNLGRILGTYVLASIAAGALSAVILIPAYASLPQDRMQSAADLSGELSYTSKPSEMLSMLYTAPFENMQAKDNYPVIYTGIVQLVLSVLFFLNATVSRRVKLTAGALLLVFAISFGINVINIAWHGFSENVWFNFRYSFIVSFILEIIAFYSFTHIMGASGKFTLAGILLAGITILALEAPKDNVGPGTLFWDVLWLIMSLLLLRSYISSLSDGSNRTTTLCYTLIFVLMLGNLLQNTYLTQHNLGPLSDYTAAQDIDQQIEPFIDNDELYRIGSTWVYGNTDAMRLGYAGIRNFASTENPEAVDMAKKLGIRSGRWRSYYGHNVPVSTDALLGVRFVIDNEDSFKSSIYEAVSQIANKDMTVYVNPFALPIIFPGETRIDSRGNNLNRFELINALWNSVSTARGNIFTPLDHTLEHNGNDIVVRFTAVESGPVYAYIPQGEIKVEVAHTEQYEDTFYVGSYSSGEDGEIVIHKNGDYGKENDIEVYQECITALNAKTQSVPDIDIEKAASSRLKLQYNAEKEGFMTSTIPFDEGWNVYVDGTEVPTYRNMDIFLAFDVPAGSHEIELRYWPPYMTLGITISAAAAGVILFVILRKHHLKSLIKGSISTQAPAGAKNAKRIRRR